MNLNRCTSRNLDISACTHYSNSFNLKRKLPILLDHKRQFRLMKSFAPNNHRCSRIHCESFLWMRCCETNIHVWWSMSEFRPAFNFLCRSHKKWHLLRFDKCQQVILHQCPSTMLSVKNILDANFVLSKTLLTVLQSISYSLSSTLVHLSNCSLVASK